MLNLTLEQTKEKHKELWTMMSNILQTYSKRELENKFYGSTRMLKEYCLECMGYYDIVPESGCFLCEYSNEHELEYEINGASRWYGMCPAVGKCEGTLHGCLNGLYIKFCLDFEHGNYLMAACKALDIANLELNALDEGENNDNK